MSAAARQALADAASTVEPVTCHPYYVQGTTAGHGYVRLDRIEYPNPFGGVAHWNVVVLLPQDTASAEKFIDTHLDQLREALAPHLAVTSVQPQRLELDGVGIVPALFINGHREAD